MAYTTFAFYKDTYGGTMDEANFMRYAGRAGYVLEAMTQNRVKSLWPAPPSAAAHAVGMAMGAVLDGLAQQEETSGRTVVLEAVGKHRIGYAATVGEAARLLRRAAAPYLQHIADAQGTPLLHRGAHPPAGNPA